LALFLVVILVANIPVVVVPIVVPSHRQVSEGGTSLRELFHRRWAQVLQHRFQRKLRVSIN
jgi:hypothetical protein